MIILESMCLYVTLHFLIFSHSKIGLYMKIFIAIFIFKNGDYHISGSLASKSFKKPLVELTGWRKRVIPALEILKQKSCLPSE